MLAATACCEVEGKFSIFQHTSYSFKVTGLLAELPGRTLPAFPRVVSRFQKGSLNILIEGQDLIQAQPSSACHKIVSCAIAQSKEIVRSQRNLSQMLSLFDQRSDPEN